MVYLSSSASLSLSQVETAVGSDAGGSPDDRQREPLQHQAGPHHGLQLRGVSMHRQRLRASVSQAAHHRHHIPAGPCMSSGKTWRIRMYIPRISHIRRPQQTFFCFRKENQQNERNPSETKSLPYICAASMYFFFVAAVYGMYVCVVCVWSSWCTAPRVATYPSFSCRYTLCIRVCLCFVLVFSFLWPYV